MEAQLSLTDITPFIDLPAKPLAYEPNLQIKGNPIIGAEPGLYGNSSAFSDALNDSFKNFKPEENKYEVMKPFTYSGDYDAANFERYYSTGKLYDKLGFSPYRNNEDLYNNKMTVGDQFVRAAKQWDDLVGAGFMSGIKSWKTMFTDPLGPDLEGARDMERAMAIGSSNTGGLSSFFINTFLNSGYTIGIGADFLAEELALTGATVLTGGALGEATVPAMIAKGASSFKKLFSAANKLEDIAKITKTVNRFDGVRAVNGINDARNFWNTIGSGAKKVVGGVADILNPLDNTIAALRAKDYATDYAKISRTFGAFADDLMMMKGAVGEAKLEGGMTKINVTKDLIDEYRTKNGTDPTGEELARIERIALDEATRTALWNLPAITTSNKLMYATMLAPFKKIMGRETTKLFDDIVFENKAFKEIGSDMFSKAKVAAKSLAKPKFYGQFGLTYLKGNLAEGVQENIQEAISAGASKHAMALYRDPIRAGYEGYMPYFMKGLGEQFSAQGAETFAGGFAMGLFAQPIMAGPSVGISKILDATVNKKNVEALREARNKQLHGYTDEQGKKVKGDLEYLNELYENPLTYFAPDLENAVRTGRLANDMYSAARAGNKKEAIDAKDALQTNHIMTALRTGKFDIMMNRLADYKNLAPNETAEAFEKYGIGPEDADKAMSQIDGVISRAKEIKKNYEDVANQYPNPYEPGRFKKDPTKMMAAAISKKAWDEAAYHLVFAKSTFQDHSKRVADIANNFSNISSELAREDSQSLMSLLSPKTALQEINNLRKEISVLDESIPEQKKIKSQKVKQLEKLDEFYNAVAELKHAKDEKGKISAEENAKKTFGNYVGYLAKKNDNIVFDQSIAEAYNLVKDHMLLKDDMRGLAESINVLMAPKSFLNFQKRLIDTYTEIFDSKADLLKMNSDEFHLLKDINDVTNSITKATGLILPQEFILELAEAKNKKQETPYPEYLLDENGEIVMEGPKFLKAMEMWQAYAENVQEEKTEKGPDWNSLINKAVSEKELDAIMDQIDQANAMNPDLMTAISSKREVFKKGGEEEVLKTFNSYKPELRDRLSHMYQQAEVDGKIAPGTSLAQFLSTDPDVIIAIKSAASAEKLAEEMAEKPVVVETPVKKEPVKGYTQTMPGGRTVTFNPDLKIWEFRNKKGKLITNKATVAKLIDELSSMPGIVTTWWTKFITDSERALVRDSFNDLVNKYQAGMAATGAESFAPTERMMLMEALQGAKFKVDSDVAKNVTDVDGKWLGPKGFTTVDEFINNELNAVYQSYGMLLPSDTSGLINDVYDMINEYPRNIRDRDITEYKESLNPNQDILDLKKSFAAKHGLDIEKAYFKLESQDLLNYSETAPEGIDTTEPPADLLDITKVEPVEGVHPEYQGKVIFVTPGSGKTNLAKTNEQVVDADDLLLEAIQELNPEYPISDQLTAAQNIFDAIRYAGIDKTKLYNIGRQKVKEMAAKGKTVITSSTEFMKDADYVMNQTNPEFIIEKYDRMKELTGDTGKATIIGIYQDIQEVIKKSPQELVGVTPVQEETEVPEITIEDINNNLTADNLALAQERGYDAIYKNNRYAITKVDDNSVSLKALDGTTMNVDISEITAVTAKEDVVITLEDNKDFKASTDNIKSGIEFDDDAEDLDKAAGDIEKNIC